MSHSPESSGPLPTLTIEGDSDTPLAELPSREDVDIASDKERKAHPLSLSPVTEMTERTPTSIKAVDDPNLPDLILPDPIDEGRDPPETLNEEIDRLQQAMSESVHTLIPTPRATDADDSPASLDHRQEESGHTIQGNSGADLILPIMIYAVVKANPSQLASQLMFLQRYRSAICLTGEASYAIVNLTAVIEFLEHVELAELGLGKDEGKVIRSVTLILALGRYADAFAVSRNFRPSA